MIISRTPFRFTLGGGGTDIPSFYQNHGGFVISMAIDKYIYITLKPDKIDKQFKIRYSQIEIADKIQDLKHNRARESLNIVRGLLSDGMEINTCADISSNSGLGSSGSFLVGLLNGLFTYSKMNNSPECLADNACNIEINILKEPVGKQDQYIAAYGGIRVLDISKDGNVNVSSVNISNSNMNLFLSKIHVYNTNIKRNASEVLSDQQKLSGNSEEMLKRIKEYGYKTLEILESGNFDQYGLLLDDHWKAKKNLSSKINIENIDKVYDDCKNNFGVLGGKLIGAGGGGFFMMYVPEEHKKVEDYMFNLGYNRLSYNVDYSGSRILGNFLL